MTASRSNLGLWIAIAALCVNAPRLVQAFLEADGLQLHPQLRPLLMGATGVAAALTLTGGGAWLAHELARGAGRAGRAGAAGHLQGLLLTCWVLVLLGQLVLIPPLLMTEMPSSRLGTVLPESWQRWAWAFVAVLLVELVAAGAMVAQGRRAAEVEEEIHLELEQLALVRAELEGQVRSQDQEVADLRGQLAKVEVSAAGARQLRQLGTSNGDELGKVEAEVPCRNGCGWVGRSRRAECGHLRACPRRSI